ncbi:hypothetical protein A6P54_13335 [Bacillus sp. MKU004]|nr:hypothetical protein A6P54_13335 [Bacillus sp. MKU004]
MKNYVAIPSRDKETGTFHLIGIFAHYMYRQKFWFVKVPSNPLQSSQGDRYSGSFKTMVPVPLVFLNIFQN